MPVIPAKAGTQGPCSGNPGQAARLDCGLRRNDGIPVTPTRASIPVTPAQAGLTHMGRGDQASGLRRLLDRGGLRVVSVSAGEGASQRNWAMINLAGALAQGGSEVLILDAGPAAQGVAAALGLHVRFDLEDVIGHRRELHEVILRGPAGINVLPFSGGARSLARWPAPDRQWLVQRCAGAGLSFDTLLADAEHAGVAAPAAELIVLAGSGASAVTQAYANVKRLCLGSARRDFQVLVSNVQGEGEARAAFGNIARVARRHLCVSLDFLGHVPNDDRLRQAARLRIPVVTAFPDAASAVSLRKLAHSITGWPRTPQDNEGLGGFMRGLIDSGRPLASAAFA